jgi:threonine synthase
VNVRPYYAEGSKSLAFEVVEQLGWRYPDAVVVPVASGSLLTKIGKGFRELHRVGLVDVEPTTTIHGAQAEGCAPIAHAFRDGLEEVAPVKPKTIAKSLAIGNPADGYYALQEVRSVGGDFIAVPEDRVVDGMRLLARTEGVFTETAGGVTIAALEELVRTGRVSTTDETVVLITGIGLKTLEALADAGPTDRIRARVEDVEKLAGVDG